MQNITILRSLACFPLKLYSSLAANSSIHMLQRSTFCPWRLRLRSATRWLKKSLYRLFVSYKETNFYRLWYKRVEEWQETESLETPDIYLQWIIAPCYLKWFIEYKEGKTLWRINQVKVQRIQLSSDGTPPATTQTTTTEQGPSQESKFTPKTSTASNGKSILFHLHPLSQHTLFSSRMWTKWIFGRQQISSWSSELPLLIYTVTALLIKSNSFGLTEL